MGPTYTQIAVAVLVAVPGIVNTLTGSILDGWSELGVLRAVGGLLGQMRRTIWMDAMTGSLNRQPGRSRPLRFRHSRGSGSDRKPWQLVPPAPRFRESS